MVEFFTGFDSFSPTTNTTKTFPELLKECRDNEKLRNSVKLSDKQVIDALLVRAKSEMRDVAKQWNVTDEKDIERMTAEMVNGAGRSSLSKHSNTVK